MRRKLVSSASAIFAGLVMVLPAAGAEGLDNLTAAAHESPGKPSVPENLRTTSPPTSCTSADDPAFISDNTPVLRATVSSTSDEHLLATFQWQYDDGTGFGDKFTASTPYAPQGELSVQLPELNDDGLWRWRARADNGDRKSAWSQWCYLYVDTVAPGHALVTISDPYALDEWITVKPLVPATLTIDRNVSDDVNRFQYAIGSGPITTVELTDTTAQVSFVPSYGLTQITVRLMDKAGNVGPAVLHNLQLSTPPIDHAWMLNEDTVGEAPDLPGGGLPLAFAPTEVTWDGGNLTESFFPEDWDRALRFSGMGAGAHTDGPAITTAGSFTVMAKVRLDEMSPAADFVALSQDGAGNSTINIGLKAGRWTAWGADSGGATFAVVGSAPIDQTGPGFPPFPDGQPDWQHLAAVYDSAAGEVRLYVDGNLAGTQAYTYGTTLDGSLRLGRGQSGGGFTGDASGRVDDAIAAGFAMSASDIRRIQFAETTDEVARA
jgi:hypothetical protein